MSYIQGMNEVLSAFLYEFHLRPDMNEVKVYNYFSRFMYVFFPSFYSDPEFLSV